MRKPIIIDTDPGCDDALAIIFAFLSQKFDLRAITTVAGNATVQATTNNARFLLNLLQASHIPIFSGADKPLRCELEFAVVHGTHGLGRIKPILSETLTGDAVLQLHKLLQATPNEHTVVALAPLTNLAKLVLEHPGSLELAKEVIILGGSLKPPGNKGPVSEFNFYVDPDAADIVMQANVKKVLIPLEVCFKVVLQREDFLGVRNVKLRQPILDMMEPYINANEEEEGIRGAIMYDALPFFYLLQPEAFRFKELYVRVETKGELTRGMSVANLRINKKMPPNVLVAEDINANAFRNTFSNVLNASTGDY